MVVVNLVVISPTDGHLPEITIGVDQTTHGFDFGWGTGVVLFDQLLHTFHSSVDVQVVLRNSSRDLDYRDREDVVEGVLVVDQGVRESKGMLFSRVGNVDLHQASWHQENRWS